MGDRYLGGLGDGDLLPDDDGQRIAEYRDDVIRIGREKHAHFAARVPGRIIAHSIAIVNHHHPRIIPVVNHKPRRLGKHERRRYSAQVRLRTHTPLIHIGRVIHVRNTSGVNINPQG